MLGLLCVLGGTLPSYVIYAKSKDGNLWNPGLFEMMVVAAITSFLIFAVCRHLLSTAKKRLIAGVIGSYAAFLVVLTVGAGLHGQLAETLMWMPVILLFGIPFMAPLVGMSWLGTRLMFGPMREEPDRDRDAPCESPPHH